MPKKSEGRTDTQIEFLMMAKFWDIFQVPESYKILSDPNIWVADTGVTCHTNYSDKDMTNFYDPNN